MKRILKICLVTFLIMHTHLAQAQCINGISTNPANPVNNQFDGIPQFSGLNNVFLNNTYISKMTGASFDSFLINADAAWDYPNIFNGQDLPMMAPYDISNLSATNPGNYDHILIPLGNPEERDYHWEDGWELLYLNTGFYPDGQRINVADNSNIIQSSRPPNNARVPHIIVYNRYRGTVRVFFNVLTQIGQLDNISLSFKNDLNVELLTGLSGMFRHVSPYDTPLDQPTNFEEVRSFNYDNNNNLNWYTMDFQVAYDPCVCYLPTILRMELNGVKTSNISLYGRSVGIEEDLYDATTGQPTYDRDFLVNFGAGDGERAGNTIYKKMDGMFDNYSDQLDKYDQALNDYMDYQNNFARQLMESSKALVTGVGSTLLPLDVKDWMENSSSRIIKNPDDFEKALRDGAKGTLGFGYDFLSTSIFGKEPDKPQKPAMPVASITEMNFNGSLSDSIRIDIPVMYTPGSWPNAFSGLPELNPWSYPAYNEALGLFALLETPKVKMTNYEVEHSEYCASEGCSTPADCPPFTAPQHYYSEKKRIVKIQVEDELKYAINPALDINPDLSDVYGMFKITLQGGENIYGNDLITRELTDSSVMII